LDELALELPLGPSLLEEVLGRAADGVFEGVDEDSAGEINLFTTGICCDTGVCVAMKNNKSAPAMTSIIIGNILFIL